MSNEYNFLSAEGEMSQLFKQLDWSRTGVGPIQNWPQSLKTAIGIMLNSKFPMFIAWGERRTFFYNDAYSVVLGNKHPSSLGGEFQKIWSEIWPDIEPLVLSVDNGKAVYLEDLRLVVNRTGKDEETFFTFSYSPIRDESDAIRGLFCACVETTSRIQTESKLTKSEAGLHFALEAGRMGAWSVDLKTGAVWLSEESKKLFAFDRESNVEQTIDAVIHPDDRERVRKELQTAIELSTLYYSEYRIYRDGEQRWILATGRCRLSEEGTANILSGVIMDITERKRYEEELKLAKQEAERANLSKTAFLANMSHEIRTPMTAVLGFTEVLRDPTLPEKERQDALARIDNSGRALLRVIDDILDISKVEAGKLAIVSSRFSPLEVVTEVTALLRLQAEQKGIRLFTIFEASVPEIACADSARLRQILTNLVGNAVKFTSSGEVKVSVCAELSSQTLIFEITDTGIGIAENDKAKLFQSFAQADSSITRRFGGTGLGLALSKRLAEHMNGELVLLKSTPHEGSCFRLKIKAGPFDYLSAHEASVRAEVKAETLTNPQDASLASSKILVVDDVADNQVLMRRYLESAGAQVEIAGNGEEAISKAMNRHFDVVLMDIQMPLVDGIQATTRLRAQGYGRPILALTAHAMREEIERSIQAGCNAHLTKPVTKNTLLSVVSRYIGAPSRAAT